MEDLLVFKVADKVDGAAAVVTLDTARFDELFLAMAKSLQIVQTVLAYTREKFHGSIRYPGGISPTPDFHTMQHTSKFCVKVRKI